MYDTDLMKDGGHVTGSFIKEEDLSGMQEALSALYDKAVEKYGEGHVIFQAMGDGNHSLATAKTMWENLKKTLTAEEAENHPARYALCEIENIHDAGIVFEPIHRVLFAKNGKTGEDIVKETIELLDEQNGKAYMADAGIEDFQIQEIICEKNGFSPESPLEDYPDKVISGCVKYFSKLANQIKGE
jgi:hypothetical protein